MQPEEKFAFDAAFNAIYATPIGATATIWRIDDSITVTRSRQKTISRVISNAARVALTWEVLGALDTSVDCYVVIKRTGRDTVCAELVVPVKVPVARKSVARQQCAVHA